MAWRLDVTMPEIEAKLVGDDIELRPLTSANAETVAAMFSTKADAEAAAALLRTVYRGQDIRLTITEVKT